MRELSKIDQRLTFQSWYQQSGSPSLLTLAQALDVHNSTISEILAGRRWPNSITMLHILELSEGAASVWDATFYLKNRRNQELKPLALTPEDFWIEQARRADENLRIAAELEAAVGHRKLADEHRELAGEHRNLLRELKRDRMRSRANWAEQARQAEAEVQAEQADEEAKAKVVRAKMRPPAAVAKSGRGRPRKMDAPKSKRA